MVGQGVMGQMGKQIWMGHVAYEAMAHLQRISIKLLLIQQHSKNLNNSVND